MTAPGDGAWFDAAPLGGGAPLRVAGVAPGDVVDVRPRPEDAPWADPVRLVAPGPGRRDPCCELAGSCGGCHWLHLDEEAQLAWKSRGLLSALARAGVAAAGVPLELVPSPLRLGYRFRARLQVDAGARPRRVGYHGPGSTRVVDAPSCPLLAPELAAVTSRLRAWIRADGPEDLTGVEAAALPGAPRGLVLLNPRDRAPADWPACGRRLLAAAGRHVAGVAVRLPRGDARPRVLGAPWLAGRTPGGWPVAAPAGGFLQANLAAADRLGDTVARAARAGSGPAVLELFAGSGPLSWRLAAAGARVTAVERDGGAVAAARALPPPPRGALELVAGDAREEAARRLAARPGVVVADPPRCGLGPLAGLLAGEGPPRVVLVSCSVTSLARDVARLTGGGYRVEGLTAIDLFPQTRHLETVAVLAR